MSGLELAIGTTVAGIAAQVTGRQMAARETSYAAGVEEQQLRQQENMTRTAAQQAEARRREELTSSLETIDAIRAGRGLSLTSPTGKAIYDETIELAERDIGVEKANDAAKAEQIRTSANLTARRRRMSLIAGDVASVGDLASGLGRIGSLRFWFWRAGGGGGSIYGDPSVSGGLY